VPALAAATITRVVSWFLSGFLPSTAALALLAGCRSSLPNRDPVGLALPELAGRGLDGAERRFPAELAGRPAVLLVGYEQEAQFDADRWLFGLLQAGSPAQVLELPTLPGRLVGAFRRQIDSGMRSGIPHEDWGAVVTLYGDAAARLAEFTGTTNGRNMRVVVLDADGVVRWFHDRGFSAGKLVELDRTVRALAAPREVPRAESAPPAPAPPPVPAALDAPAARAGWPQWRGPTRDGRVAGASWPATLTSDGVRELWSVTGLGPSYSGPLVVGERVVTTETVDEEREVVRALERSSGRELWRASWDGALQVPFFAAKNGSWIRATPASDGAAVYVAGIRDVLVCLDLADGKERWRQDFVRLGAEAPAFGCVSSPLVAHGSVFLQAGGAVVALDAASGAVRWRALEDGGGDDSAFSSPVLATLAGREQLVVQTRSTLAGLDPPSGALLWSRPIEAFRGMNILTPLVLGDALFTSAYGGRALRLDLAARADGFELVQAWDTPQQGYMTSPIAHAGHAYLFLRSNRFACLDLASGEERWTSGPTGDEYWSLVAQGERILALSDTGTLRLIAATPAEYRVLGELELVAGPSWAHLAVAGDESVELHVREQDAYRAFRWER
jgi:outer membrane protein assembly factor BamB